MKKKKESVMDRLYTQKTVASKAKQSSKVEQASESKKWNNSVKTNEPNQMKESTWHKIMFDQQIRKRLKQKLRNKSLLKATVETETVKKEEEEKRENVSFKNSLTVFLIISWVARARIRAKQKRFRTIRNELKKVIEGGEIDGKKIISKAEEKVEDQPNSILYEVDLDMYTDKNLAKRQQIKKHTKFRAQIDFMWYSIKRTKRGLEKYIYELLASNIYALLVPDGSEIHKFKTIQKDWKIDSKSKNFMNQTDFFDSMYMLADTWCETCNVQEYIGFIRAMHSNIAIKAAKKKLNFLEMYNHAFAVKEMRLIEKSYLTGIPYQDWNAKVDNSNYIPIKLKGSFHPKNSQSKTQSLNQSNPLQHNEHQKKHTKKKEQQDEQPDEQQNKKQQEKKDKNQVDKKVDTKKQEKNEQQETVDADTIKKKYKEMQEKYPKLILPTLSSLLQQGTSTDSILKTIDTIVKTNQETIEELKNTILLTDDLEKKKKLLNKLAKLDTTYVVNLKDVDAIHSMIQQIREESLKRQAEMKKKVDLLKQQIIQSKQSKTKREKLRELGIFDPKYKIEGKSSLNEETLLIRKIYIEHFKQQKAPKEWIYRLKRETSLSKFSAIFNQYKKEIKENQKTIEQQQLIETEKSKTEKQTRNTHSKDRITEEEEDIQEIEENIQEELTEEEERDLENPIHYRKWIECKPVTPTTHLQRPRSKSDPDYWHQMQYYYRNPEKDEYERYSIYDKQRGQQFKIRLTRFVRNGKSYNVMYKEAINPLNGKKALLQKLILEVNTQQENYKKLHIDIEQDAVVDSPFVVRSPSQKSPSQKQMLQRIDPNSVKWNYTDQHSYQISPTGKLLSVDNRAVVYKSGLLMAKKYGKQLSILHPQHDASMLRRKSRVSTLHRDDTSPKMNSFRSPNSSPHHRSPSPSPKHQFETHMIDHSSSDDEYIDIDEMIVHGIRMGY